MGAISKITSFRGEYGFLSNFRSCTLHPGRTQDGSISLRTTFWLKMLTLGVEPTTHPAGFPSAEHLFQAMKTNILREREMIRACDSPWLAKSLGRSVTLNPRWEEIDIDVMRVVVGLRFEQYPGLAQRLLHTGDADLIEGNTWGDDFWGVYKGEGENWLGKILMETRAKLRTGKKV